MFACACRNLVPPPSSGDGWSFGGGFDETELFVSGSNDGPKTLKGSITVGNLTSSSSSTEA